MSDGPDLSVLEPHVCGMTWGWTGVRGTWATPAAEHSLDAMRPLNLNWVTLAFAALQDTVVSTEIPWRDEPTPTDDEVRWAIRQVHERGWKACLKPTVNCRDGIWRGYIGFFDWDVPGEAHWSDWFAAYEEYIVHFAAIAQQEGVEMLCIGCEMVRSDPREAEWRALIAKVRAVYSGLVTYNCDKYQEDHVTWWDAVDVISASGYYPTGQWEAQLDRIEPVVRAAGKPFLFIEAGCPSRDTSPQRPNDWTLAGAPSGAAQASYLSEMFEACRRRDWVGGFALWDWPAQLYDRADAATNTDYCMYGKPGEDVVTDYYASRSSRAGGT